MDEKTFESRPYSLVPFIVEPPGKRYLGVDLLVYEGKGRLAWMTRALEENNISIVTIYTDASGGEERAVFLVLDLTDSPLSREDTVELLGQPRWVRWAGVSPRLKNIIYSGVLFPPLFGSSRGVGIGRAHMKALFLGLKEELGSSGASLVLCNLARKIGATVAREYARRMGLETPREAVELLRALSNPSGYGYIEDYTIRSGEVSLYVRDDWEALTLIEHGIRPEGSYMKCFLQSYFSSVLGKPVRVEARYTKIKRGVISSYRIKISPRK